MSKAAATAGAWDVIHVSGRVVLTDEWVGGGLGGGPLTAEILAEPLVASFL